MNFLKVNLFFAEFPNKIFHYYFEDSRDYLNELNEIFKKYNCFEKFWWLLLNILFYEHNEKKKKNLH